jgi:hypothetical protein
MESRKSAAPVVAAPVATQAPLPAARPVLPAGVQEIFLAAKPGAGDLVYRPRLVATAELHYADKPAGIDSWSKVALLAPLGDNDGAPEWSEAATVPDLESVVAAGPVDGAGFGELPAAALNAKNHADWARSLAAHLYQSGAVELLACKTPKLTSNPGESEGDFRTRLAHTLREYRDEQVAKLRDRHAAKLRSLDDRLKGAQDRVAREQSQYSQRKLDTVINIGTSVLGAIFGGRSMATTRAGSAARSAGRVFGERGDVARAGESLETLTGELTGSLEPERIELARISIAPRKSDIGIGRIAIAWEPWRTGADGFPHPASTLSAT